MMQDRPLPRRQEKITIETPYGTIESDSGNHLVDLATVFLIILVCAALKYIVVKKIGEIRKVHKT
tara:strand:+ start:1198 stop:1392 length:195 start_codon:yes stop_codon:yes gene_type:complete